MDRIITELLRTALDNIDNLYDYYNSQKKYVKDYVTKNLEKYKYGVMIDRYFWKKTVDLPEYSITKDEQEEIDKILLDYSVEKKDDGYVVSYKLNRQNDFSGYEMDPQIARTKFVNLIQQPTILSESIIMMLLVKYEEAIAGLFRFLLEICPQAYLSEKSITYAELVSIKSNIEDIKDKFICKEIDEFMRLPISNWYKSFETKHKAKFEFKEDDFEQFKEVYYRRNLIVHNQGIVNDVYKNNIPGCTVKIGEKLVVDENYLNKAFSLTKKIVIGTIWGLKKTADDINELNEYLFNYGYDCLKMEKWDIAEYIYEILLTDRKQKEIDIICEQVNMWISIKNGKGIESIKGEIEELDISAMQTQFAVAKYALLDDFDKVNMYLEEAINKDIPAWCVNEWPLLKQYRNTSQYQEFANLHKDLFETKGYEPNKETVDLDSDEISALEEGMKNLTENTEGQMPAFKPAEIFEMINTRDGTYEKD